MTKARVIIGLLAASACAAAQGDVPSRAQLQGAFAQKCHGVKVLTLRCLGADDPTEAECRYSARKGGKVLKGKSMFFVDATGWHMMDQDDAGQCPR
jgi:hypothetical protein